MTAIDTAPGEERGRGLVTALRGQVQQLLAFASLIVICAFVSFASPFFFSYANFTAILFSTVVIGALAVGTTFVIVAGGIDLSIGTGMALCSVVAGVLLTNLGLPLVVGVLGAVCFGGLVGLVNGLNVAVLKIPPFIATLAMLLVADGLALVLSNSQPIYLNDVEGYTSISTGTLIPQVPNAVLILLLLTVVGGVILRKSLLGRYTYAIGSNEEAAALSGVNVRRWKIAIYSFAGLFTGIAGVLISARLGSAQPATGLGYELEAIAAVIVGGTSLAGGKGTIIGTLIGALIISVINNGLQLMSIPQEWQDVILGIVILLAVYTDMIRKKEA